MLTGNQITDFFEDANRIGIENRNRIFLQEEGINTVGDLVDFTEDKIWHQVIENCKRPPHVVPVGDGAKVLMRLNINAVKISYYEWKRNPITAGNI